MTTRLTARMLAASLPVVIVACAVWQAGPPPEDADDGQGSDDDDTYAPYVSTGAFPWPPDECEYWPGSCDHPPTQLGGICDSGLASDTDAEDACLTASCCDSFNACVASTTCRHCLTDAMAPGCEADSWFEAFNTCSYSNCPTEVCGFGVDVVDVNGDPLFACIGCASDPASDCCAEVAACVGDGSVDAIDACNTCLADPAVASDTPMAPTVGDCFDLGPDIYNGAVAFRECLAMKCAAECD